MDLPPEAQAAVAAAIKAVNNYCGKKLSKLNAIKQIQAALPNNDGAVEDYLSMLDETDVRRKQAHKRGETVVTGLKETSHGQEARDDQEDEEEEEDDEDDEGDDTYTRPTVKLLHAQ